MMCDEAPVSNVATKYLGAPLGYLVPSGLLLGMAAKSSVLGSCSLVSPKTTRGMNPLIGGAFSGRAVMTGPGASSRSGVAALAMEDAITGAIAATSIRLTRERDEYGTTALEGRESTVQQGSPQPRGGHSTHLGCA